MNTTDQIQTWQLEISYIVQCVCCLAKEEANKPTPEQAIAALQSVGWTVRDCGPWCPECAPLLVYARRGRNHGLKAGDSVKHDTNRPIGKIQTIGDGYAEVRMLNGQISIYPLAELSKA